MYRNNVDSDLKPIVENDNVFIINNPKMTNVYSIYLTEHIGESKNYRDVFNLLREAGAEDYFKIYLNNFGGYVSTGQDIINAMRACQGQVFTCITGPVYSMAPLIALAGQKIFVEQDVFMMFHDYSGGQEGKGNEMALAVAHEKPHFDSVFRKLTKGFLSDKEATNVLMGQDLYLGREEIIKRLKKIKKLLTGKEVS